MPNPRRKAVITKTLKRKKKRGPSEDSGIFAPWLQGNRRHKKIPLRMPYDR